MTPIPHDPSIPATPSILSSSSSPYIPSSPSIPDAADSASVATVYGLFAQAAERTPDAPAHVDPSGAVVSYRELFRITTQLAELIKEPHHDRQP
ncbi:hypothetical protein KGQ19_09805 [Catenulispora sp. NL8]|uniref:AMP-dependent synthetase/ligase domain-containing protein n=1 Tax=Catenulispora pinistramenti TaxID=2705254 RepID=A0ABS5KMC3_9ACTN|nr:hypothetical protein [Catenulispora pinistramenti]